MIYVLIVRTEIKKINISTFVFKCFVTKKNIPAKVRVAGENQEEKQKGKGSKETCEVGNGD